MAPAAADTGVCQQKVIPATGGSSCQLATRQRQLHPAWSGRLITVSVFPQCGCSLDVPSSTQRHAHYWRSCHLALASSSVVRRLQACGYSVSMAVRSVVPLSRRISSSSRSIWYSCHPHSPALQSCRRPLSLPVCLWSPVVCCRRVTRLKQSASQPSACATAITSNSML